MITSRIVLVMAALLFAAPLITHGEPSSDQEQRDLSSSDGPALVNDTASGFDGMTDSESASQQSDQILEVNRRSRMIMATGFSRSDPTVVLGLNEWLSLSSDQVLVLKALAAVARQKARSVLSDEQRSMLDMFPSAPESMNEMHERLMAEMQVRSIERSDPDTMDSCPVFQMMMEELEAVMSEMAEHRH